MRARGQRSMARRAELTGAQLAVELAGAAPMASAPVELTGARWSIARARARRRPHRRGKCRARRSSCRAGAGAGLGTHACRRGGSHEINHAEKKEVHQMLFWYVIKWIISFNSTKLDFFYSILMLFHEFGRSRVAGCECLKKKECSCFLISRAIGGCSTSHNYMICIVINYGAN